MQRLLVALLAAFDAAIAAAVGLVVLLAPLTLLWTVAFGVSADWGALWPLTGTLWQFGHGVPLSIDIAGDLLRTTGIAPDAAAFTLSVTPLAFLLFTLLFAARSGARAARAGAWLMGSLSGAATFAVIAAGVALTSHLEGAATPLALGMLLPPAVYLLGAMGGAVRIAWEDGDGGALDRVHDVFDSWGDWGPVPSAAVRGAAFALVGVTFFGALAIAVATLARGGEVVALFQAARVDALGATVITLGQLAYLPTAVVWAVSWLAGPGFAVGAGTAVSPAGTQLGVVPGLPILGILPENTSIWMLVVVILPIAAGAFAGWAVRSRLVWEATPLGTAHRAVIAVGIGALTAGAAAVAAVLGGGSMGPGRLVEAGPDVLAFSLALGGEVLLGAAILLLSPRNRDELAEERTDRWLAEMTESERSGGATENRDVPSGWTASTDGRPSPYDTVPLDDLGPIRPAAGTPQDPVV